MVRHRDALNAAANDATQTLDKIGAFTRRQARITLYPGQKQREYRSRYSYIVDWDLAEEWVLRRLQIFPEARSSTVMWPFTPYPEASAADVDGKAYDYIIVGGGTAGCVIASRLSEDPSVSVLVLEKGHVKDNFVSRVPLISQNFWMGDPLQVQSTRYSEPMPDVNGRRNRIWTAEGIGGASRINALLLTRGVPGGYQEWAEEFGLDEWGWDKVEPYFRRSENATAHPESAYRGHDDKRSGHSSGIHSKFVKGAASFGSLLTTLSVDEAARKVGLSVEEDCNNPTAPASGLFNLDMTIDKQGYRVSTYRAFLNKKTAIQRRKHLTVCTGVVVSSLDIDEQAGLVRGVYIRRIGKDTGEKDGYVKVKREVIVSSGAICSPQILLLSGIGPKDQLEAHGIAVKRELPVGTSLQDHYSAAIMLTLPKSETLSLLESILGLWHFLLFIFTGRGLMGGSSTPKSIFVRTSAIDEDTMAVSREPGDLDALQPRNIPDIEIMIHPVNSLERVVPGHSLFSFYPTLVQPKSVGSVELRDRDPLSNPRIVHPMLRDERDLVPLRRGIRFTMRLAEEFQKSGYPYPAPTAFAPGNNLDLLSAWERSAPSSATPDAPVPSGAGLDLARGINDKPIARDDRTEVKEVGRPEPGLSRTWRDVTDDEIDDYVRRVGMGSLHASCTCPMSRDDRSGVVDQRLRVHGIRNLRVADASVFPKVTSGHTMAPTIMVGERCADFIKEEWRAKKTV
ncbi:hypothetical protein SLS53_007828 [Cytospora paraplurivora]|uniref:Glucose-methanol-choline oxidoreductase N-terminal domain-containing protein n=1 Tax=Cytospora paraplurivora TaxID=2898453 RepID=A0AAN9U0G2_9PEZI